MRRRSLFGLLVLLAFCTSGVAAHRDSGQVRVVLAGADLPASRLRSAIVDSGGTDNAGVDRVTLVLEFGQNQKLPSVGDAIELDFKADGNPAVVGFAGEIVGVEPAFNNRGAVASATIRAFDKLHRLTRGKKERTFQGKSDADIARALAAEAGLAFGETGPEATQKYDHVYQHNQTDLEFLRTRAARIGYQVWVEDTTLRFARPVEPVHVSLGCPSGASGPDAAVRVFHPRLSSASAIKKVIVRGWDPERKEEIVAEATRPAIALSEAARKGGFLASAGQELDLGRVSALETATTLYGAADGALAAATSLDLSAEADTDGHALLRAGTEVTLVDGDKRFGGKYLVIGASHRFERGAKDGWHTFLRLVRSDRGVYVLPEVGDEVLIAFDGAGLMHPYVIGSLWNGKDKPMAEAPFCGKS